MTVGDESGFVCENCADPDEDLVLVRRSDGGEATPELWCASCRSHYPHDAVEEGDDL